MTKRAARPSPAAAGSVVEVEVLGRLLLKPEPLVLGRVLQEVGRLLEQVLALAVALALLCGRWRRGWRVLSILGVGFQGRGSPGVTRRVECLVELVGERLLVEEGLLTGLLLEVGLLQSGVVGRGGIDALLDFEVIELRRL